MNVNIIYKEYLSDNLIWRSFLRCEDGFTAKCKLCPAIIKLSSRSTKGLHTHLRAKHQNVQNSSNEPAGPGEPGPSGLSTSSTTDTQYASATPAPAKKVKMTDFFSPKNKVTMEERVARMTAKDGLPFAKFADSWDLRELFKLEGHQLPSSANSIRAIVMNYGTSIKQKIIAELQDLKTKMSRFCLTFDEWTSSRNHRYLNINIHVLSEGSVIIRNLGLVRVSGSFPAETCVLALEAKIKEFGVDLNKDVISMTTDGAAVMKKVGRLLKIHHQLCFAHGLQLAVLDVIYKKTTLVAEDCFQEEQGSAVGDGDNITSESDDEEFTIQRINDEIELLPKYSDLINKVRRIVNLFKRSPMKNDLLQTYIKSEHGSELQLILDCKTRWSSLASMIERFNRVKQCVSKALIDLRLGSIASYCFTEQEYIILVDIERALQPIKLAVNVLCREDATLLSAETTLCFMMRKLHQQNTALSKALIESLHERIRERRTSMTGVFMYLENPAKYLEHDSVTSTEEDDTFFLPNRATLRKEMKCLIERLHSPSVAIDGSNSSDDDDGLPLSHFQEPIQPEIPTPTTSLEEELELTLQSQWATSPVGVRISSLDIILRREMTLLECGGNRGKYLDLVYKYIRSIPPTSVESERAFSAAGYICTKVRSNLNDESINILCFLRKYFQKQTQT